MNRRSALIAAFVLGLALGALLLMAGIASGERACSCPVTSSECTCPPLPLTVPLLVAGILVVTASVLGLAVATYWLSPGGSADPDPEPLAGPTGDLDPAPPASSWGRLTS